MQKVSTKEQWEQYVQEEVAYFTPILEQKGYTVDPVQPHVQGERFLMQAVTTTSGRKVILLGKNSNQQHVVIKATRDSRGSKEIQDERNSRELLTKIKFAYNVFFTPEELFFEKTSLHTIFIQEFIEQEKQFIDRPIEEQFTLALSAFKAQEGARATTYEHTKVIKKTFLSADSNFYIGTFSSFLNLPHDNDTARLLKKALEFLKKNRETIDRYGKFLTHTDFVPHNIRVRNKTIYLLDHSSLRFGNKYEGWARFLNFMILYNKKLEEAFLYYLRENRNEGELLALKLMRIFRLGEIISFYTSNLPRTEGKLNSLTQKRITLWTHVMTAILNDAEVKEDIVNKYKEAREKLRSYEEKERQKNLH